MKDALGIAMFAALFVGIGAVSVRQVGWRDTALIFVIAAGGLLWIAAAAYLVVKA